MTITAPFYVGPSLEAQAAGDAAAFMAARELERQEAEAAEAARQAELERQAAEEAARNSARSSSRPALPAAGDGDCANPVISAEKATAESGCRWDAYNAGGCSGRGCLGFYQLDAGHFYAVSPWNPNVSGSCYGLDPSTREGQTACALRLDPSTAWR